MWLVRGSEIVYRLHCVTLTAFTASESSCKRICLVAAVAHSDYAYMFLSVTNTLTYLLTYCYCILTNCYHETSINKTVKLHVPSPAVLELENVNAKASNF